MRSPRPNGPVSGPRKALLTGPDSVGCTRLFREQRFHYGPACSAQLIGRYRLQALDLAYGALEAVCVELCKTNFQPPTVDSSLHEQIKAIANKTLRDTFSTGKFTPELTVAIANVWTASKVIADSLSERTTFELGAFWMGSSIYISSLFVYHRLLFASISGVDTSLAMFGAACSLELSAFHRFSWVWLGLWRLFYERAKVIYIFVYQYMSTGTRNTFVSRVHQLRKRTPVFLCLQTCVHFINLQF